MSITEEQLGDFLRFITTKKKGLSEQSVRHARIRFLVICRYLKEKGLPLSKDSIEQFLYDKQQELIKTKGKCNGSTINTYFFVLRYIQDYLIDRGHKADFMNDFENFETNRPNIVLYTDSEIERIYCTRVVYKKYRGEETAEFLNFTYLTFIRLLAETGGRFNESRLLLVKNFDLEGQTVTFTETKNGDPRTLDITDPLISQVRQLIRGKKLNDLVFTNFVGSAIREQEFSRDLKMRSELAGIVKRSHPHLFRHTFLTQLIIDGVDISMVAQIAGHKDIQTTFSTYVHLAREQIRRAMFKHRRLKQNVSPYIVLENAKEGIEALNLSKDDRFNYRMVKENGKIEVVIEIKEEYR